MIRAITSARARRDLALGESVTEWDVEFARSAVPLMDLSVLCTHARCNSPLRIIGGARWCPSCQRWIDETTAEHAWRRIVWRTIISAVLLTALAIIAHW